MNRIVWAVLLSVAVSLAGCSSGDVNAALATEVDVVIEASGAWQGSIGTEEGQQSVDGTGSRSYTLKGNIISAAVQKKSDDNSPLTVKITRDGKVLKEATTTSPYGMATVSYDV